MAINLNGETMAERDDVERDRGSAAFLEAGEHGAAAVVSAMLTTLGEALGGFDQRLGHLEQAVGQALFEAGAESKALVLRLDEVVGRVATRVEARVDDAMRDRIGDTEILDALAALATRTGALLDHAGERLDAIERSLAEGPSRAEEVAAQRVNEVADAVEVRLADRIEAGHRQLANYLRELLGVGLQRMEAVAASVAEAIAGHDAVLEQVREETVAVSERTQIALSAAADHDRVTRDAVGEQVGAALSGLQESYDAQAARAAALAGSLEEWRNEVVEAVADVRQGARDVLARVSDSLDDLGGHLTSLATRTEPTGAMAAVADQLAERLEARTDGLRERMDAAAEAQAAAADRLRAALEELKGELDGFLEPPGGAPPRRAGARPALGPDSGYRP